MAAGKFYITPNGDAYTNMALDEWALEKVRGRSGDIPAILRIYTWNKGAITFGYNQKLEKAVDLALVDDGTAVIRRITGGRAIYHDPTELTFSLVLDINSLPSKARSLSATNRLISDALVEILARFGHSADWLDRSDRGFQESLHANMKSCFGSVSKYEVIDGHGKIAGGAQRRLGDYLVHQGSIKINGISEYPAIGQKASPPSFVPAREDEETGFFTIDQFAPVFREVFGEKLEMDFKMTDFLPEELEEIMNLRVNLIENCLEKR
ncbi:MAG: hypothetical protein AB1746_07985 [Candidatus Zixiibacteriota bacterium]